MSGEIDSLGSASGRHSSGVKVHDDSFADEARKGDAVAVSGGQSEIRGRVTGLKTGAHDPNDIGCC